TIERAHELAARAVDVLHHDARVVAVEEREGDARAVGREARRELEPRIGREGARGHELRLDGGEVGRLAALQPGYAAGDEHCEEEPAHGRSELPRAPG